MSQTIEGNSGKFDVYIWRVGDDIRINVYNEEGSSTYFATDSNGAKKWVSALNAEKGSGTFIIREDRSVAEVTRVGDEYHIVAYDTMYPNYHDQARFSVEQAQQIIAVLRSS